MRNALLFLLGVAIACLFIAAGNSLTSHAQSRIVFEPTGDAATGWSCPNNSIAVEPFHGMTRKGETTYFPSPIGTVGFESPCTTTSEVSTEGVTYSVEPNLNTKPICISR